MAAEEWINTDADLLADRVAAAGPAAEAPPSPPVPTDKQSACKSTAVVPLRLQASAEHAANTWGALCGEGCDYFNSMLAIGDAALPPPITVDNIDEAAASFPEWTGLGWDDIQPRAVFLLSHPAKLFLV